ncbi:MAG: response regulator [Nitrospirae bacterium]|nr:response regulator [Nitrospirota bacterium]MBF0533783.1 response regulator [Nitrospirota bacterium]MBF0615508.1 response regulator [Nitrospirota bacterium]
MGKYGILLVDDDSHLRKLYKGELEDEGYAVHTAASGMEALQILEEDLILHNWGIDLVTLDILMPGMDGIEVLRRIKEKSPCFPVIMSTAYDYQDDFSVWASDAYVIKSADLVKLKQTLKTLLGRNR